MYQNILVAIDGSATSDCALREALKFAQDGVQITVVTVIDNPLQSYSTPNVFNFDEVHAAFYKQAEDILKIAESDAERLGHIKIKTCLVDMGFHSGHDDIAPAILRTANDYHADLIVMGTHGRRGIKRLFLGSVAELLVREAHLPVLLVHSPDHDVHSE